MLKKVEKTQEPWDLKKLDLLKEIHDKTKCTIVLSSSWRYFWFKDKVYRPCLKTFKKDLKKRKIRIRHKTGFEYKKAPTEKPSTENPYFWGRGFQIKNWLNKHPEVKRFAILDDDSEDLFYFGENFVKTCWYSENEEKSGLTKEGVEKCIEILKSPLKTKPFH